MENKKIKKPEDQNPAASYTPTNKDFQRAEGDLDNISKSEKEELEKRKQRTHEASTKPDKNHVG